MLSAGRPAKTLEFSEQQQVGRVEFLEPPDDIFEHHEAFLDDAAQSPDYSLINHPEQDLINQLTNSCYVLLCTTSAF